MKKVLGALLAVALILSMSVTAWAEGNEAKIGDKEYATLNEALKAAVDMQDTVTVTVLKDIDGTKYTESVYFDSYTKPANTIVVEGNGHTITSLAKMLFSGTWTGTKLEIKDLTIKDSHIVEDKDNEKDNVGAGVGVGAFIGNVSATEEVVLTNCHVVNSTVEGGNWTGGLIGYAAGYSVVTDGPVFTTVTVKDCSVTDSTVTGKGSAGGIVGHATGDVWTNFTINDTTIADNKITSTGSNTEKAGAVMGTVGDGGSKDHSEKTGGVFVDVEESNNTVTSSNKDITTIYGRRGSNGKLTITGGVYDDHPIAENEGTWAALGQDLVETEVNGRFYVTKPGEAPKEETKPSRPSGGSSRPSGQWFTTTLEDIQKVTVGGKVLDSQYYTVAGTDVLISQEYIDKLAGGSYQVVIENATHIARGTLTVKGAASVESAKTFDAGIALYAGMALSSAMGAAYVCTKKKH